MPYVQQLSPSGVEKSNVVVGSLARLTPVELMPERYSRHMKILTKLKQIRQVQVSRSGASYILDVYTTSQSTTRIPTRLMASDSALAAAKEQQSTALFSRPDIRLEKQFADFVKLRDELYDACHTGPHLYMNCRFCSEVTRYLLFGAVLPGSLLTWMLPQRQRTKAVQSAFGQVLPIVDPRCKGPPRIRIQRYETVRLRVAGPELVLGAASTFTFQLPRYCPRLLLKSPSTSMTSVELQPSCAIVVGGLARLTLMHVMPEKYSRHMHTVSKLKQVRSVLVSSVNGSKSNFTIDVFTPSHSMSRIPTSLKAAAKGQRPDVHVDKQFSDFVRLRDELYESCKTSHPTMDCPFCSEVARTLLLGAVLPGTVLTLVLSQHQQTKAVQRFIESLLVLAASCPVFDSDACPCQEELPRQLFKFLFGDSEPLS